MANKKDILLKDCEILKLRLDLQVLKTELSFAKDQLALTEKALELACNNSKFEDTCDYCAYSGELEITKDCPRWCETDEKFFVTQAMYYFKEQAKEMMKSE